MTNRKKPLFLRLAHNKSDLEFLHDRIIKRLETKEKSGICRLLKRNNSSVKTMLYPYLQATGGDAVGLLEALDSILEVHARECYAIGVLDSLPAKKNISFCEKNLIN